MDARPPAIKQTLRHAGFFCMRTPLLTFGELLGWSHGLDASTEVGALRQRLRAIVERPEIREAIFIASPGLAGEIDVWIREPASERGEKVERGLVRYLSRMCGRATPFGLFAGCSVGTVGTATDLALESARRYRSHTRLDMNYVGALAEDLLRLPELRDTVTFRTNSSLYRISDQYRYFEWKADARGHRTYGLVAVPATDYLSLVIARCASGARRGEVIDLLAAEHPQLSRDDVEAYVAELIASQVLVADFPPRVTGPEPLEGMIARTQDLASLQPITEILRDTLRELTAIDAEELGGRSDQHRRIATRLGALATTIADRGTPVGSAVEGRRGSIDDRQTPVGSAAEGRRGSIDAARLFQVDLVKPARATIGPEVIAEVTRAVELLHRLSPASADDPLFDLAMRFAKRYEGREVRLVEALDEEWGISPPNADPSPLLEDLPFTGKAQGGGEPMLPIHTFLLREIQEAIRGDARVLVLDEARLRPLFTATPAPLLPAFSVMATIAASSSEAIARGDFKVVIEGVKGPSGTSLMGRFCHADPLLSRHVEDFARAEQAQRPDVIYAELVHLPQNRVGNILARPVLTDHEIVYLGQSGAPIDKQLAVIDLLVSVVNGRFVLRSERLGREVIPRMTTAHTLYGGLAVYRFLGQLASAPALALRMGPLDGLPFIPRLVVGRTVLHLATWRATREELSALDQPTPAARFRAVQALRETRRLPRLVAVKELDNELPIDLDNALSVESFVHLVKARPYALLVEIYPGPDELCAEGPEGRFVHELVIPFLVEQPAVTRPVRAPARLTIPATRQFGPGSEWLYVKLYTGATAGDRLLREVVDPIVQACSASRACTRWFFLRYADPDFHLRIRFFGKPRALRDTVFPMLHERCAPLLADGLIHRIQLDTYERETERYGGDEGIVLAERLFHADSEAALAVVRTLDGTSELADRWRFALLGIDLLLQDLRLDLGQRRDVIEHQRAVFGGEFDVGTLFERALGAKFRKERGGIDALFDGTADERTRVVRDAFRRRSQRFRTVVDKLLQLEQQGRLTVPVAELAKSFIHMHANRFLRSAARPQELVLYDFLDRCYVSQLARAKQARPPLAVGQA